VEDMAIEIGAVLKRGSQRLPTLSNSISFLVDIRITLYSKKPKQTAKSIPIRA
jgi:hypothetical protein